MEELKVSKNDLIAAYHTGTADQKSMLENLYGKEVFTFNWREITSYEKACEVLSISPIAIAKVSNRPQYTKMACAIQKMLVICEAINGPEGWYNKYGNSYYPVLVLYDKKDIEIINRHERMQRGISKVLATTATPTAEIAGVRCTDVDCRGTYEYSSCGFPICLNSEEKAEFVGKQFFELYCQCYGLTPLTE